MPPKINGQRFIRFLKDEKFIEWKLLPTDESNAYWNDFSHNHPNEHKDFRLAEKHFQNINLSSYTLSEEKKNEAIKQLEASVYSYSRKRKLHILAYAVSACAAVLFFSLTYLSVFNRDKQANTVSDIIVGNKLDSQDIQLISNNRTTSFNQSIRLQIAKNGTVQVNTETNANQQIAIDSHALNKLIVPYGKRSQILLADGTKAWLNSGSTLEFPASFDGDTREVRLSGEMYIEVAPNKRKPFYVHTNGFSVQVLGTKFNISAYNNFTNTVALLEGSVQLKSTNENAVRLMPNQQAVYESDGNFKKETVDASNIISWKDGYLVFDETPVSEVLKSIERYYNLSFNYEQAENLRHITCKGRLNLSDNLDNVMNSIAFLSASTYRREGKLFYIIGNTKKINEPMKK